MALFEWKDEYSVGVEKFDNQHKGLFNIINRLHSAMMNGKGKDVLSPILSELMDYTNTHFGDEEKLMETYKYDELEEHKQQHRYFVQKIEEAKAKFEAGRILVSVDLLTFLRDWLIKHILGTDKKYASFFKEFGVK